MTEYNRRVTNIEYISYETIYQLFNYNLDIIPSVSGAE